MKLAILDDDADHNRLIAQTFAVEHDCICFDTVPGLLRYLQRETIDLLILDWNLPSGSGLSVLTWARANLPSSLPVLMITSRSGDEDILSGFAAGADDYIVKPAQTTILKGRVEALLRRAYPPVETGGVETFGEHIFDVARQSVRIGDAVIDLTAKEFQLAHLLFRNLSRAMSRGYLLERIWGLAPDLPTRTLDAHISRIRLKLQLRPQQGFRLSTVYSYGYRLEKLEQPEEAA